MTTPKLNRLIRYYSQCYQASFHGSEGHGVFDRDDVIPLAVYGGDDPKAGVLTELQTSAWLVDNDQMDLVLFRGFQLSSKPNKSFTTEAHYLPLKLIDTSTLIRQTLTHYTQQNDNEGLSHFQTMLADINLAELDANTADFSELLAPEISTSESLSIQDTPEPDQVNRWLINQAKKSAGESNCSLQVLALVPKDIRSYRAKADFADYLAQLSESGTHASRHRILKQLLVQELPTAPSSAHEDLLNKLGKIGFGNRLDLPGLSAEQNRALRNAFTYDVSLLQGPPGTGKSYALAVLATVLASLNKSVLITAHTDAALDVIQNQLTDALQVDRSLLVRFGKGQRQGRFAQQVARLMNQAKANDANDEVLSEYEDLVALHQAVEKSRQYIADDIAAYPIPSPALLAGSGGLGERVKRWFFWRRKHRATGSLVSRIEDLHQQIESHQRSIGAVATAVLKQRFQRTVARDTQTWSRQTQAIRNSSVRGGAEALKAEGDRPVPMQSGLGIWLVKLEDIPDSTYGDFDWVIIDEATQVNLASAIPAMAKAKSLVVAGDPRQLRHVSFLSNEQESRILSELELSPEEVAPFRKMSLFDFTEQNLMNAGTPKAVSLLDEHYRSIPPLMRFNSEQFYNNDVQVLTGLHSDEGHALNLSWQQVNGRRIDKVNQAEVDAIVQQVKQTVEQQATTEKESLGVLSFFTDQTEALKRALLSELSVQQVRDHRLKIGTPFSFQGAERDHMFISCGVDVDAHPGTWNYLNRPDVFNVATSRARTKQTLFLSVPPAQLPTNSILRQYHGFSFPTPLPPVVSTKEPWLQQLVAAITAFGARVEYHHRIADIEIDLLVTEGERRLGIDLIAFPGKLGGAVHLSRYAALRRVGIELFALTAFDWMFDPQQVVSDIRHWLENKNQRLQASPSKAVQPAAGAMKTSLYLSADRPDLVNEPAWSLLIECSQSAELSSAWGFHINDMVRQLRQMDALLPKLFQSGSVTYVRYKSAVNSLLDPYLENLSTYRLLHAQVWEASHADRDYWQQLTAPIMERHQQVTEALSELLKNMQIEVARSGSLEEFALKDVEALTERLKKF